MDIVSSIWATPDAEKLLLYMARVSSPNQGSKNTKLIRYLLDNKHFSPFEMIAWAVEINTSRAISPQILRHRSFHFQEFCIDGDSLITCVQPNGTAYKRKIRDLYGRSKLPMARVFDGTAFTTARITNVFSTGAKDVYRITLANGKSIVATKDHKFLTANGFTPLEHIIGLEMHGDRATMSRRGIIATNGIPAYQSKEWMAAVKLESIADGSGLRGIADRAGVTTHTIRKWLRIHSLQFTKKEVASYTEIWNKGRFGYSWGKHSVATIGKLRKSARKGSASNLWRGGSDRSERLKIADWCNSIRSEKLKEYNYQCKVCGSNKKLELDHIVPVFEDISKAYDYDNIQVLCETCHDIKHNMRQDHKTWRAKSKGNTLTVTWSEIISVEYFGVRDTYDLEVDHTTHNYVANGIVVHNSQRYAPLTDSMLVIYPARRQDDKNRQNSIDDMPEEIQIEWELRQRDNWKKAFEHYQWALDQGIAKECARMVLPMQTATRMYMHGTVRDWIFYITVRTDPTAQKEHRDIAELIRAQFIREFPIISEALGWL